MNYVNFNVMNKVSDLLVVTIVLIYVTSSQSEHTNNWAVLVDTSRFWFNYRHAGNVLALYHSVKRLGIPDSHIILMIADDFACNPRNPRPGTIFDNANEQTNLYGEHVEVDYRGYEVTVENFIRVLTGRLPPDTPQSKRLDSDDSSNILIYLTGHGGDGFVKFQDAEEISAVELADAFEQMNVKRRYHEMLVITDSCQAASMGLAFYSPNIIAVGSSRVGEDSLSHHQDPKLGVYVADRYTYYALEFLNTVFPGSRRPLNDFLRVCPYHQCLSHVVVRDDLFTSRSLKDVLVVDFFGAERHAEIVTERAVFNMTTLSRLKSSAGEQLSVVEPEERYWRPFAEHLPVKYKFCLRQD